MPPPPPSESPWDGKSSGGKAKKLGGGAITGIVVALLALGVILGGMCYCRWSRICCFGPGRDREDLGPVEPLDDEYTP
jgi:hypothetical protein